MNSSNILPEIDKSENLKDSRSSKKNSGHSENKYTTIPVNTGYIKPGESYNPIIHQAGKLLEDGDFLVISETPIAISQGRLVDEAEFEPSLLSTLLAELWSKRIWGYFLGPLLRIKSRTIKNLRKLPKEARSHKQLILEYYGIKHALKPASEAGVDLSNVPGTCVCLLPEDPQSVVQDIHEKIRSSFKKEVTVMIVDTDATYQLGGMKFTSIPLAMPGIRRDLGVFGYVLGRWGNIKGPTPLAVSRTRDVNKRRNHDAERTKTGLQDTNKDSTHDIDKSIEIAKIAEECQEKNDLNLETVYDMKKTFDGGLTGVTVEMLESIEHTPAVIVREL